MIESPERYRGEVVQLEGRLARVVKHDTLRMVEQAGVEHTYEVWLYSDRFRDREGKANTALLICTSLPKGVPLAESMEGEKEIRVTFVGYFFKKYGYTSGDTKKGQKRLAPLLIGHLTLTKQKPVGTGGGWTSGLVPFFLLVIAGTFIVVFLMTWGYRRADQRILRRMGNVPPLENLPEPSAAGSVEKTGELRPPPANGEERSRPEDAPKPEAAQELRNEGGPPSV